MDISKKMPTEVKNVIAALEEAGYSAYAVGGAVRDIVLGREPKDWDVATSAKPEDIMRIFPDSVYENQFGTVGVKTRSENKSVAVIEVTTFRKEGKYSDFRHPDEVKFSETLQDDLSRRDFTVNAMAISLEGEIIDPFGGRDDVKKKTIRTVGDPAERFSEDALRLMRAVRFAAELGFDIEAETFSAIVANADLLGKIAEERIRDELTKIIMSDGGGPAWGIVQMEKMGLLKHVVPELLEGIGVTQNKHHIYTVWEHNLRALDYSARNGASLEVRIASLLHDVGKPRSKEGDGPDATFHAHEVIGARMAKKIMERLKFPKDVSERVVHLVRHHLFYYNVGEVTEAGVRRFISRVGEENIDDLFKIREADRIGSGVPKAVPYKTRHLRFMMDKVRHDPISPKMLKVDGVKLMDRLKIAPGPRVGMILGILLEDVLDEPERNDEKKLLKRAEELNGLGESELADMAKRAKETKSEFEAEEEREMKKRHKV
jgi:poly(A) polymerase/tRNA nucleotidyltransferase (CCA-adding enzyme)